MWLLLTGKWRILTIELETILEIILEFSRLEKGYVIGAKGVAFQALAASTRSGSGATVGAAWMSSR